MATHSAVCSFQGQTHKDIYYQGHYHKAIAAMHMVERPGRIVIQPIGNVKRKVVRVKM